MPARFAALLCDMDGVVRHWDPTLTSSLEKEFGLASGSFAEVAYAPEMLLPAVTGRISDHEWRAAIADALASTCSSRARAVALVGAWSASRGTIDTELLQVLETARTHTPVALVSNATTRLEDDLAVLGLMDAFDAVVSSARVGAAKPDPAIYLAAAARLGADPARCLFVDDTPGHVEAARRIGMSAAVYRSAAQMRELLGAG